MSEESDVEIPSWIDKVLLTTIIRSHTSDLKAEVYDFVMKPDLSFGEHGGSSMCRVEILFSSSIQASNSLSVVIKVPRGDQLDMAEIIQDLPIFETELDMYNGPLKDMKNLLESVGDMSNLYPELIYQTGRPRRMIVMKDLGVHGYKKITQPLQDYEASKAVFERLAKFHAAGFFLINEKKIDFR